MPLRNHACRLCPLSPTQAATIFPTAGATPPTANALSALADAGDFLGVFAILQWAWGESRDTWVERLVIHQGTVIPAAALVQWITPEVNARPVAASIKAPGGGLNILNGCEGTEVMFLLITAFAAVRLGWRRRLIGLGLGLALIFVLNQARILALFYAYGNERSLFEIPRCCPRC